jgi:hypothetical protein
MLALLLGLMTLSDRAPTELELVARAALPIKTNSGYALEAVAAKPPSTSVVFAVVAQDANRSDISATLRFDGATKRVSLLDGHLHLQEDCDLGIASIDSYDEETTTVIGVGSGRTIATIDTLVDRVGALALERDRATIKWGDPLRLFDARSGSVLRKVSQRHRHDLYVGRIAWDDGRLRMFATQRKEGDRYRDGYELYKAIDGFNRGESVVLFEVAQGFDRIVGNPSEGPFAAEYSSNRLVSYVTLTQNLKETKFQADQVLDISRRGVLGRMIVKKHEHSDPDMGPVGCWNPLTGEKLWQLPKNNHEDAYWLDRCALVGEELRHHRTGKVLYRLPADRTFIAARADLIWVLSGGPVRKLEVWRVR